MAAKKKAAKKAPTKRASKAPPAGATSTFDPAVIRKLLKIYDSERIPLGQLDPDKGNPRDMSPTEFENLIASLAEFGLVEPFVARAEDRRIVGGHQRASACAEYLRRNGVPEEEIAKAVITVVFVPGLTESKCRALNLALNRVHGEWSWDRLPDYIGGIEASDMGLTGFAEDEVKDILALGGGSDSGGDDDPDTMLSAMRLQFSFKVATLEEADFCKEVLGSYGMTGPKDLPKAFVAAMRAAKKKAKPASTAA